MHITHQQEEFSREGVAIMRIAIEADPTGGGAIPTDLRSRNLRIREDA